MKASNALSALAAAGPSQAELDLKRQKLKLEEDRLALDRERVETQRIEAESRSKETTALLQLLREQQVMFMEFMKNKTQ